MSKAVRKDQLAVDALDPLHKALAEHFADVLVNGEEVKSVDRETGEVTLKRVPPSAAMLNQIRQFLKDNGVEAASTSQRMRNLTEGLPFSGSEDEDEEGPQPGPMH